MKLSSEMQLAVDHARKAGGGKLIRSPGGFWAVMGAPRNSRGVPEPYFGTTTVEALVKRGAAEYSAWQNRKWDGKPFPIEVTIL